VPEQTGVEPKSKSVAWLVVALLLIFFTSVFLWYYFNKPTTETASNSPATDQAATKDTELSTVSNQISSTLEELESEIAAITSDANSTDDDAPNL